MRQACRNFTDRGLLEGACRGLADLAFLTDALCLRQIDHAEGA